MCKASRNLHFLRVSMIVTFIVEGRGLPGQGVDRVHVRGQSPDPDLQNELRPPRGKSILAHL